jgi:hypothetical protein
VSVLCVCVCVVSLCGGGEGGARGASSQALAKCCAGPETHTRTQTMPHSLTRERSKIPTVLKVVPAIPRNAMGKVGKKALRAELWPELASPAQQPKQ